MIVISLMSSIWKLVKPSTRFLILTYLPNFTLVVNFGRLYITHQRQYVSINSSNSYSLPVESVFHSILGRLLFIIYTNDLLDSVYHSLIYLFADDTKCFRIKQHSGMDFLQSDINCLFNLSTTSHLSFHPSKSLHLFFILHNQ